MGLQHATRALNDSFSLLGTLQKEVEEEKKKKKKEEEEEEEEEEE